MVEIGTGSDPSKKRNGKKRIIFNDYASLGTVGWYMTTLSLWPEVKKNINADDSGASTLKL